MHRPSSKLNSRQLVAGKLEAKKSPNGKLETSVLDKLDQVVVAAALVGLD